jgi:predicted metal-dependent hydrolase
MPADRAQLFSYAVRRSTRARRVRVTVDRAGTIEVVLPQRAPERAAADAVRELRPWIDRRLAEAGRQRAAVLARGGTLPFLGQTLEVRPEPGRSRATRRGQTLLVPDGSGRQEAIERWYRRMAREEIGERLDRACAIAGLSYSRLTIRDQRTRWGSCSRGGAMSFNWRLLLAPEAVLDYVIWHEVCHLQFMDHSPRFWGLVARYCPGHREQSAWLRRNAGTLVL